MKNFLENEKGFWGLVSLILAACISMWLVYVAMTRYYSSTTVSETSQYNVVAPLSAGIDTRTPTSVLESTTRQIKAIEAQNLKRGDQLMQEAQDMANGR